MIRKSENDTVRRNSEKTVSAKKTDSHAERRTSDGNTGRSVQTGEANSETVTRHSSQFDAFSAVRSGFDSYAEDSDNIGLQGAQTLIDTADDVRNAVRVAQSIRQSAAEQAAANEQSASEQGSAGTEYGAGAAQRYAASEAPAYGTGTPQWQTAEKSPTEVSSGTIRRYPSATEAEVPTGNTAGETSGYRRDAGTGRHTEGEVRRTQGQLSENSEQKTQSLRRRIVDEDAGTPGTAETVRAGASMSGAEGSGAALPQRTAVGEPTVQPDGTKQPGIVRMTSEQRTQKLRRRTVGEKAGEEVVRDSEVPASVQETISRFQKAGGKMNAGLGVPSATTGLAGDIAKSAAAGAAFDLLDPSNDGTDGNNSGTQVLDTARDGVRGTVRRIVDKRIDGAVGRGSQTPRATTPTREAKAAATNKGAKAAATNDSQFYQKQKIKEKYAAARKNGWKISDALKTDTTGSVKTTAENVAQNVIRTVKSTLGSLWRPILIGVMIFALLSVMVASCTAGSGIMGATIYSSYTAEPEDIVEVEEYYSSMENSLWESVEAQKTAAENSGEYYRVELKTNGGVGHDPWKLASLLTVLFEDYKLDSEVKSFLSQLLDVQYDVSTSVTTEEIVTGTETYHYVSSTINVRSGPGTMYSRVGTLTSGTEVTILSSRTVNGVMWYRIGSGQWIAARYVKSDTRDIVEEVEVLNISFQNYGLDAAAQNLSSAGYGNFDTTRYNLLLTDYGNRYSDLIEYDPFKTYRSHGVSTISTGIPSTTAEIWDYLMDLIGNEYGVAGLIGNLYCESSLMPNNLQDTYNQSLGYDDAGYTSAVDSGSYSNFTRDAAGYGLAQWTDSTRKTKLYNFWRESGASSISDLQMQLDYLAYELQTNYSKVLDTLKSATSVRQASDAVLTRYEIPTGWDTESKQAQRASYGECFYNYYVNGILSSGELTDAQRAVVYVALSMENYVTPQNGYCLGYVCSVIKAATGVQGGGHCAAEAKIAYANSSINYDMSVVPVGAAVFTTQTGSKSEIDGHDLGHVGIYIGNGQIIDCASGNGGCLLSDCGSHPLIHVRTVEHWQNLYSDLSWGWIGNCNLATDYADSVASGIPIS